MDKKYQKIFISILIVCALIAILDIVSMSSGVFGSPQDYTLGNYTAGWWNLFFKIALSTMLIFSFAYYFFYNKDISESIAIFIGSYAMWRFGLSDIMYFIFQGQWMPDSMPWLFRNAPINIPAKFLGLSTVTPFSLIVSIIIGGILTWAIVKFLKEKM